MLGILIEGSVHLGKTWGSVRPSCALIARVIATLGICMLQVKIIVTSIRRLRMLCILGWSYVSLGHDLSSILVSTDSWANESLPSGIIILLRHQCNLTRCWIVYATTVSLRFQCAWQTFHEIN